MRFLGMDGKAIDNASLETAYKSAHAVGVLRIADEGIFFRAGLKNYFLPYEGVRKCFRRVMNVPAKMCCGRGDFSVESIVFANEEKELAEVQLPGEKAAKLVFAELKEKMPDIDFSAPARDEAEAPA